MNQKGFSLIELLIGMTIFILILAGVVVTLQSGIKSQQYNTAQGHNLQNGRVILNYVADQIRYATKITTPALNASSNQLAFEVAAYDKVTKTYINPKTYIIKSDTYQGKANTLATFTNGAAIPESGIAPGLINSIDFRYAEVNNRKQLTVSITLNDHSYTGSPAFDLSTTIQLPNL